MNKPVVVVDRQTRCCFSLCEINTLDPNLVRHQNSPPTLEFASADLISLLNTSAETDLSHLVTFGFNFFLKPPVKFVKFNERQIKLLTNGFSPTSK